MYLTGTPDEINNHFAAVATDSAYNKNRLLTKMNNDHISKFDTTKSCDVQYSPDEIAIILSRVTKTATGSDGIPYWVFKECECGVQSCTAIHRVPRRRMGERPLDIEVSCEISGFRPDE